MAAPATKPARSSKALMIEVQMGTDPDLAIFHTNYPLCGDSGFSARIPLPQGDNSMAMLNDELKALIKNIAAVDRLTGMELKRYSLTVKKARLFEAERIAEQIIALLKKASGRPQEVDVTQAEEKAETKWTLN